MGTGRRYPLAFRAAILRRSHAPLSVETVIFDGPLREGQVLVRVHCTGICGKQIEEIDAAMGPDPWLPHMLGHEGAGTVVDIGSGVTHVQIGDCVVMHWLKGPGIEAETPLYRVGAERINAGWITTFNEYAVVSENRLTTVPAGTDPASAALFGCAASTGIGAVVNDAGIRPGQSLVVVGCGGVGLAAVQAAAAAGATPLIAVDSHAGRLRRASAFGATHAATPAEAATAVRNATGGNGAAVVLVTAGSGVALELGIACAAAPGRVYMVGVPPADATVAVPALDIHRGKTLTGSYGGGCHPDRDIPRFLAMAADGRFDAAGLIGMTVPLDDINRGIEAMRGPLIGRCIVDMRTGSGR
ncbi:MAG: zinc-binding dehydrogenase [Alphaproteobacteria bacterium]